MYVFVKCFTKFLKVNRFTTIYKEFYNKLENIFKFNHILQWNKQSEMLQDRGKKINWLQWKWLIKLKYKLVLANGHLV